MRSWLRRVRGAIGIGLAWAGGWAPIGGLVGTAVGALSGFPLGGAALNYAALFGVLGFTGGTLFSSLVRIADGRRRFDELSLPRFCAWGGFGGLALGTLAVSINLVGLGGVTALTVGVIGAIGLLGAGSAAGTLALARHADDRELLATGRAAGEVGLTELEEKKLLAGTD